MNTTDPIITVDHVRHLGMCSRGMRTWFKRHGFDLSDFLINGLPCSRVEGKTDALGDQVARAARRDAAGDLE